MKPRRLAALLAAALALAACAPEETAVETPGRPVVLTPVLVQDIEDRIEASGELRAKDRADVSAQVAGEITEVLVEDGDPVEAGAVVMEIDPERRHLELDRARARVGEAEAAVAVQRREVARMRALAKKNVASATQLDQAETALQTAHSRLDAAKADLGVADLALRDATVTARFDGYVAERYVDRGEFVQVGQRLFDLVSLDPIEVEFHLPEADASRVAVGQPIEVTVAPYPEEVFDATVRIVSPTVDPRTRTLRVNAVMPNERSLLRPGFFARVDLGVARREDALLVPEEAVVQRSDGAVVFALVDGNRVDRRIVEVGVVRDGFAEIRAGLAPTDSVVSRGHSDLIDGSVIEARNPDGTLATRPTEAGAPSVASGAPEASSQ